MNNDAQKCNALYIFWTENLRVGGSIPPLTIFEPWPLALTILWFASLYLIYKASIPRKALQPALRR